ncbi:hypothetical protein GLYMA_13G007100v4 [Glycine max]|uniref:Uncharacterized protein n=1 Tax=Glycine max TaxID=3847 RepID=K7LYC5_SOYBN|nr:hypothetical protein GYH30_034866 [Glycine max]KRH17674.1 hypothetical protein GLYMA_13G007100v4 [Glycine max]
MVTMNFNKIHCFTVLLHIFFKSVKGCFLLQLLSCYLPMANKQVVHLWECDLWRERRICPSLCSLPRPIEREYSSMASKRILKELKDL